MPRNKPVEIISVELPKFTESQLKPFVEFVAELIARKRFEELKQARGSTT